MKLNHNFLIYQLMLKGKELSDGETGVIADKEVAQRIFDADFRDHSLDLVNPSRNTHYLHEYVKVPKDGLYLLKVINPKDRSCLDVLIDTRIFPNFVLIEDNPHLPKWTREVIRVMDHSLCQAAAQLGWDARTASSITANTTKTS